MAFLKTLFRRPQTFRDEVEAHLRGLGDQRALEWDDSEKDELLLDLLDRRPFAATSLDLTEPFQVWKASGDLTAAKHAVATVAKQGAVTEPGVLPLLNFAFSDTPSPRRITTGLNLELMWSGDGGLELLDDELLASKKLTFDQALALATRDEVELTSISDDHPLFVSTQAGLVIGSLARLKLPTLAGEPLFIVVDRMRLLVTGTGEGAALQIAAGLLLKGLEAPAESMLGLCFALRDGALVPWLPPRSDTTLRTAFIAFRRAGLEAAYEQQRAGLANVWEGFIPKYSVERAEGLPMVAVASWAKGLTPLLPRADILGLGRTLTDHRPVSFDVALQRFPHLLERAPLLWPPRYIAKGFPTDDELAALPASPTPDALSWFDVENEGLQVPAAQLVSTAAFAKECLALLEELGVQGAEYFEEGFGVRYEIDPPAGVTLEPGMKALSQVGFRTPYDRYGHLPDGERQQRTRNYLTEMTSSLRRASQGPARESIMPLLRPFSASWRTPMQHALQLGGSMQVTSPAFATRGFTAGLQLAFVVDTPQTVQFVTEAMGNAVAGSRDGLFELAVENLRRSTTKPLREVRPGLYESPLRDEYDATRLLLSNTFFGLNLKGTPVAFVPNRTTLLVTGSDDDANLIECFGRVRLASREDARPVTSMPLALTSEGWQPWLPKASSAARAPLGMLFREALEADLAQSAELLSARFPGVGVARLATKDSDALPQLLALVDDSKPTHLPKSDVVSSDGGTTLEPWPAFAAKHASRLAAVEETEGQWFKLSPR